MTTPAMTTTGMLTLDRHVIGALVRHQQLVPGALGVSFYDIPPDPGYIQQVAQWHQSQPASAKLSAEALKILAAPDLVADIRALTGKDSLLRTWALSRTDCQPGPILLAATENNEKQLKVQSFASREMLADTLLLWLVAAGEPGEPEMRVEMTHAEFAVLLALIDLYSRAKYSAFIAHRAMETSFSHSFIYQAYDEALKATDPRWLLGYAMALIDEPALHLDPQAFWQALQGLVQRRFVEAAGQEFRFTVPGEFLAESLHRRTVSIAIDTAAADPQGGLGTHGMMLVRSDEPLWFVDLPAGGKVTVSGVSMQAAREILDVILTPVGRAPAARPPAQHPPTPQAVFPPTPQATYPAAAPPPQAPYPPHTPVSTQRGAPPPAQPGYGSAPATPQPGIVQCRVCGQRQAVGAMFCGNCGSRLG
jgi:hypothetical protein